MNCQKGDLARVISNQETKTLGIADCIVTVIDPEAVPGGPGWKTSPQLRCRCNPFCLREIEAIGDAVLRPIRGQPGADETLSWVDVPSSLEQPA